MKAKLIIEGKEIEIEISEEEYKKLQPSEEKKTGYERVPESDVYFYAYPSGCIETACEECYRYDICRRAKTLEELLSSKIVKLNFSDLSKLILNFPSEINTLMIQKSFDGYYIIVDDITIRKEQERKAIKTKF